MKKIETVGLTVEIKDTNGKLKKVRIKSNSSYVNHIFRYDGTKGRRMIVCFPSTGIGDLDGKCLMLADGATVFCPMSEVTDPLVAACRDELRKRGLVKKDLNSARGHEVLVEPVYVVSIKAAKALVYGKYTTGYGSIWRIDGTGVKFSDVRRDKSTAKAVREGRYLAE